MASKIPHSFSSKVEVSESLDVEFMSLRILIAALERIAVVQVPNPMLPVEVVDHLRRLVSRLEFKTFVLNPDAMEAGEKLRGEHEAQIRKLYTSNVLRILNALVKIEVEKMTTSVLKVTRDGDVSKQAIENHVFKMTEAIMNMKREEGLLAGDIVHAQEKTNRIISQNLRGVNNVSDSSLKYLGIEAEESNPQFVQDYMNFQKKRTELISLTAELAFINQTLEESQDDLDEELLTSFVKLDNAETQLEKEHGTRQQMLDQYEGLGPEFKTFAEQYGSILQDIKTKEWVLEQLNAASESFNLSLSFNTDKSS